MRAIIKISCSAIIVLMIMIMPGCTPSGIFFVRKNDYSRLDEIPVRILLAKADNTVTISSKSPLRINGSDRISPASERSFFNATFTVQSIKAPIRIDAANNPVEVNGNFYRGKIELRPEKRRIMVINIVSMHEYLLSVVPGEILSTWGREALKAQAIAARTYAYYHLVHNRGTAPYDLDSSTGSQVYRGMGVEKKTTSDAVIQTAGMIATYRGAPILSYFHSTCGGKTTGARHVWSKSEMDYLRGVRCEFCKSSTKYSWEAKLSRDDIRVNLRKKYGAVGIIKSIQFKKNDDRVSGVVVLHSRGKVVVPGNAFRLLFSADSIRSLYFTSRTIRDGILLKGRGWGHGVGMCQWGARGMAEQGYSFRDILRHYYSGISIDKFSNSMIAARFKERSAYQ